MTWGTIDKTARRNPGKNPVRVQTERMVFEGYITAVDADAETMTLDTKGGPARMSFCKVRAVRPVAA